MSNRANEGYPPFRPLEKTNSTSPQEFGADRRTGLAKAIGALLSEISETPVSPDKCSELIAEANE